MVVDRAAGKTDSCSRFQLIGILIVPKMTTKWEHGTQHSVLGTVGLSRDKDGQVSSQYDQSLNLDSPTIHHHSRRG